MVCPLISHGLKLPLKGASYFNEYENIECDREKLSGFIDFN